ncbi:hypothetical protein BCAR13_660034 [Paraburkholderia caribensis]|nr:hypothetical protein BCAR13_660034 [Paraburkholderia caribensis]
MINIIYFKRPERHSSLKPVFIYDSHSRIGRVENVLKHDRAYGCAPNIPRPLSQKG